LSHDVLIVGAGFAGATYARELAEHGINTHVIDRRPHIGGNSYDELAPTGVRIHKYGPHLFHTNNPRVVEWLMRFARLVPYEHRVQAALPDGQRVPLPINRRTMNLVFGVRLRTDAEAQTFLRTQAIPSAAAAANAAEYLNANIGRVLTDLFFRPYTRKMWALDLEDLDAAVVKRIPIRMDEEDRYFPDDRYQFLPEHGYARLFDAILDHPCIRVTTSLAFRRSMLADYAHCFNSMAVDEYFDNMLGALPYRSIRFHHREEPAANDTQSTSVVNFTDAGPFTRETDWARLPGHAVRQSHLRTITREEPCDYRDNDLERYYPVKTSDGRYGRLYEQYAQLAAREPKLTFIGRCGTFQYLDMHQVINQSLAGAHAWLAERGETGSRARHAS
jgi:UDP-galactopyranose mutase